VVEQWGEAILSGAEAGLKKRSGDFFEREITRTRAKLGEMMMKLELPEILLENQGACGRADEAQEARSGCWFFAGSMTVRMRSSATI
jgi:hypothetical protein